MSESREVVLPALGLTMTEGTIVRWLKEIGDPVAQDEPLVTVETDKAGMDVLAPFAGVLAEIVAPPGARIPVGQPIARLGPMVGAVAPSPATATPRWVAPIGGPAPAPTSGAAQSGAPPVGAPPAAAAGSPAAAPAPTADRDASIAASHAATADRDGSTVAPPGPSSTAGTPAAAPPAPSATAGAPAAVSGPPGGRLGHPAADRGAASAGGETVAPGQPADPVPEGGDEAERLRWLYRTMYRIRIFDERIVQLFSAGRIAGALHSYVGEEAVAAGVAVNLRPDDAVVSTHRGHGHLLAKGGRMDRMMAELFGRVDGYCRGKGGSMHITDVGLGILGANGIVGAGIPIATGAGTAIALRGGDQVVVCFFGDGASNIGSFHEGINLASVWRLPVIFVCENNGYAQFTPQRMHTAVTDLFGRAQGYGIPGVSVDGNDAGAVAAIAAEAIARARAGQGPTLIEAKTFRWYGHAINNPASAVGRDQAEIAAWKARDPIPHLADALLRHGIARESDLAAMRQAADAELEAAVAFADASPSPPPESALEDVYAAWPVGAEL